MPLSEALKALRQDLMANIPEHVLSMMRDANASLVHANLEEQALKAGGQLIAIAPELPEQAVQTRDQGNDHFELPMPATYIIRQDGVIASAFVDADYTQRMEPTSIIETLNTL